MNIIDRYKKPTPKFIQIIRKIAVALVGISGAIWAISEEIPQILITIAYGTVIGSVAITISQAVDSDIEEIQSEKKIQHES